MERLFRRTEHWQDDPLSPSLARHKARPLIQVASGRDTQFDVYGASNEALRCRVLCPRLPAGSAVKYEVYEPVNGISKYQLYEKLDWVGPWMAMELCKASAECAGFTLVVRDGHAYLFTLEDEIVNLRMREPYGNGGDPSFRIYIKVADDRPTHNPIRERDMYFSDYAFVPWKQTKLPQVATFPEPKGVVVSLTTIPSRIDQIQNTLLSLVQQTRPPDMILLALPTLSTREGGRPYTIPAWLRAMSLVTILEVEHDYGPATKLIPAVQVRRAGREMRRARRRVTAHADSRSRCGSDSTSRRWAATTWCWWWTTTPTTRPGSSRPSSAGTSSSQTWRSPTGDGPSTRRSST